MTSANIKKHTLLMTLPLHFFSMSTFLITVPFFEKLTEIPGLELQLVILAEAIFQIAYGLSLPIWGYIIGRVLSRKKLVLGDYAAIILLCLGLAITPNWWFYLIVRSLMGVLAAAAYPLDSSLIADAFPTGERIKAFTYLNYAELLGQLLILVAGLAASAYAHWRVVFTAEAIPIVPFLIISTFLKEPQRGMAEKELKDLIEAGIVYGYTISIRELKSSFSRITNLLIPLQGFFGVMSWQAFTRFGIYFFQTAFDISIQVALIPGIIVIMGWFIGYPLVVKFDEMRKQGKLRQIIFYTGVIEMIIATIYVTIFIMPHSKLGYHEEKLEKILADLLYIFGQIAMHLDILLTIILLLLSTALTVVVNPTVLNTLSETSLPEERGAVIAMEKLMENVGGGVGIAILAILQPMFTVNGVVMWGILLAAVYMFLYITGIIWIITSRFVERDVETVRKILTERGRVLIDET